jgi:hypothetical protein
MGRNAIYANAISFVILAALLSWISGGIGIFYAAGFFVVYGLGIGIAAVLGPKTFWKDPPIEK